MKIVVTSHAEKELAKLDDRTRNRILAGLFKMRDDPRSVDLAKLKDRENQWRLRVGVWRVILRINRKTDTVYVLHVSHRRETYRD